MAVTVRSQRPQQGAVVGAVPGGLGNFQVATGLVINHQVGRQGVGAEGLQGGPAPSSGCLLNSEVSPPPPAPPGQVVTAQPLQRAQAKLLQQPLAGFAEAVGSLGAEGVAELAGQAVGQLVGGFPRSQHGH